MESFTFTKFPTLEKENILEDEKKRIEAGKLMANLYERVIYKWKNTMTIEKLPGALQLYFTYHKHWGVAELQISGEYSITSAMYKLAMLFFNYFIKMFNNTELRWEHLLFEEASNNIANYAVHLFQLIDYIEYLQNYEWIRTAKCDFWTNHRHEYNFNMISALSNLQLCPIETPLSKLEVDFLSYEKSTKEVIYFGVDLQTNGEPFSWPALDNFSSYEIKNFFGNKGLSHLPRMERAILTELAKKLETYFEFSGIIRQNNVLGKAQFSFYLTLSMTDWEWIISEAEVPIEDAKINQKSKKITVKTTECSLISNLYKKLIEKLAVPENIIEPLEITDTEGIKSFCSSLCHLLCDLRFLKDFENPWNRPEWFKITSDYWGQTGWYHEKRSRKRAHNKTSSDSSEEMSLKVKNKNMAECSIENSPPASPIISAIPPGNYTKKKLLRNGRLVGKRRRGTFSFPCRGYVPPLQKLPDFKDPVVALIETSNRVLEKQHFAEKYPEFYTMLQHFITSKSCTSISMTIESFRPGKTPIQTNLRSFLSQVLNSTDLMIEISINKEVKDTIWFSLLSKRTNNYLKPDKILYSAPCITSLSFGRSPAEIIERNIDQMLKIFVERKALDAILYDKIHENVALSNFSILAEPIVMYLEEAKANEHSSV